MTMFLKLELETNMQTKWVLQIQFLCVDILRYLLFLFAKEQYSK